MTIGRRRYIKKGGILF